MSSRRYPTAELYEERQRDFYRNGSRSERSYDELDLDLRSNYGRQPEFLREDYGRSQAGPLVLRERHTEDYDRPAPRSRPREREVEKEELVIRDRRQSGPPPREVEKEEIIFRRDDIRDDRSTRGPRSVKEDDTEVVIRRREQSRGPPRSRDEREEIDIRRESIDTRGPPRSVRGSPPRSVRGGETREFEREDIRFRRGGGPRPREREREVEKEEIIFRHEERDGGRERGRSVDERENIDIRIRERSLPPPRLVAREREDFVIRRRRSPSPPPRPPVQERQEEIIIRRTEQRSPTPPPPSPPPPLPEPIVRPPIVQEIITHHRHIDHGVERARSPTPPPSPPSPVKEESLEIAIRRSNTEGPGRGNHEDTFIYERETREGGARSRNRSMDREVDMQLSRRRSLSTPRRQYKDDDLSSEADFYNRKALERSYIGEGYNGATKDWAIVDVPPGTKRVRMDGAGGGGQEITWQRYNGVRRSKFITDEQEYATDFGVSKPTPSRSKNDMWTEITKDLVIKDAIDSMHYDYEETDEFFYVMEYLRYEDVLQLVEISEEIRRDRRQRIREIQFERDEIHRRPPYDERVYEREIVYDHRHRGRSGR